MASQRKLKLPLKIFFLILLLGILFLLTNVVKESGQLQALVLSYGYIGALLVGTVSGFNIAVPIPAVAFVPLFIEAGLNFFGTIAVITLGMTAGDAIGLFIGSTGERAVHLWRQREESHTISRESTGASPLGSAIGAFFVRCASAVP